MKKLAVIGCGGIGGYHLGHLVNFKDIALVGFCDLILERAESFVEKAGQGRAFSDYKEMYEETKPDMVFVCVPPSKHGEIEFETIRRGIHMFVEKPVALNMELAAKIRDAAKATGIITAVGFQCRYDNINDAARDFVENNEVVVVDASRVGGVPEVLWWRSKAESGGQLVEQTIHQLDILRYMLGEPESVYSLARRGLITQQEWPGYDTDDMSATLIKFQSGVVCHMMTGCYSLEGAAWDSKMTFGSRSTRMDYRLCLDVRIFGVEEKDRAAEAKGIVSGDGTQRKSEQEIGREYKNNVDFGTLCDRTFIDAVITGDASKIRSPYEDAMKTLALGLACNESMETGVPVRVGKY